MLMSHNPPIRLSAVATCFFLLGSFFLPCLTSTFNGGTQKAHAENPHAFLAEYSEPYYPGTSFPKLITPQWIGEPGVDAVITLGIDDMRDPAIYEAYLRPILDYLKTVEGRSPVSIMTCSVNPQDPQLQKWLAEGLSIEVHTVDHPCPCLQGDQFNTAKSTYDRCVDLLASIQGNRPVAFRTPCCDSRNTPSPRLWSEIFNSTTPAGNFLQADSSVFNVFTNKDPDLPEHLVVDSDGSPRMNKYLPFPSFVNTIENYPYPYVIGRRCWQFPCMVPSDWEAQHLHQPNNPTTVADLKAALDATVLKKGMFNLVFHPHGWIRNDQIIDVIKHAQQKYGKRVKFLTFGECVDRINQHLLLNQSIRAPENGEDNGVRITDINADGFLDVLIGNENSRIMRVWQPEQQKWQDSDHDILLTSSMGQRRIDHGVQIGKLTPDSTFSLLVNNTRSKAIYEFKDGTLHRNSLPPALSDRPTSIEGIDQGVRLRDIDGDGTTEIIIANPESQLVMQINEEGQWSESGSFPAPIVDVSGKDSGLRFVDLDDDGHDDVIYSNGKESGIRLFDTQTGLFSRKVGITDEIPLIVRNGTNNGVWFSRDHMWVQNENTNRLPDGVDRRSFTQLLGNTEPGPRSPERSHQSIRLPAGFTAELVAAEPLVMDPIAIDWGADGKLWVVEMADYPLGMDDQGEPGGRVRYLEDTDHDGKYDSSTLFLDGIAYPTGVMAWRDGVIVSAAPNIFFAADRDRDGKAEIVENLYEGFAEGNQQHRVNGFERGLDNWIYLANGDSGGDVVSTRTGERFHLGGQDLRIRPDSGEIELQTGRTQFGRHRDDHGNWFGCSNPLPVRHFVLADHYMRRNPFVTSPTPRRDIARVDNTQLFPISRVLSHWSGYRPPTAGSGHKFTSACSTMVYRDNLLGEQYAGDTFTCAPVHNLVHRRKLITDGVSFRSERPAESPDREFLASTDSWFRPTTVTTGPDGALWVVDMYRLVIEHPEWIDDEREKELFLRAGHDRGRIYRIFPDHAPPRPMIALDQLESAKVAELLQASNGRLRDMAQQELVKRDDRGVTAKLEQMTVNSPSEMGRLHALCTLAGTTFPSHKLLLAALEDKSGTVRRHAIRLCETHLSTKKAFSKKILARLERMTDDPDPMVRMQLAYSLGETVGEDGVTGLARLAQQSAQAPYLRAAIISSLNRDNLIRFHNTLVNHPEIADLYQPTMLEMASRMNNVPFLTVVVNDLLEQIESVTPSPDNMHALAEILTVIERQGNQLPKPTQDRIGSSLKHALNLAMNRKNDPKIRLMAIQLASRNDQHSERLLDLLSVTEPADIQIAATQAITTKAPDKILDRFSSLSPSVRDAAIESLLLRKSTTNDLILAVTDQTIPSSALSPIHRQSLTNHVDKDVQAKARKLFESATPNHVRDELINKYLESMTVGGDAATGKQVFVKHCAACHHLNGIGHKVGPDLATLKNRSVNALVTAIIDPGAAVENKYVSYSVLTYDGVVHAGIVAGETSTAIEIKSADGKSTTIVRNDIERIHSSGKSLMPEGMEKEINPKQMSDLIAFLNSGSNHPPSQPGNNPVTIHAKANGTLSLPASKSELHGTQFRFEQKYGNIGFWNQADEYVTWTIEVPVSGEYKVTLDYACPADVAGNTCKLDCSQEVLRATVPGTGNWDDYQLLDIGTLKLKKGTTSIRFGPEGDISGWLMDLRGLTLRKTVDETKNR